MKTTLATIVLATIAGTGLAAEWPQWCGPNRDGKSGDTGLLQQWPENGPPLAWKIDDLGGGDAGPAIADGRIFIMSNRGEGEVVWALSEKDGGEIWVTALGPAFRQRASQGREGPGCTSTVDGDKVIVTPGGVDALLVALNKLTGETIWKAKLPDSPAGDSAASSGPVGGRGGLGGPGSAGGPAGG